MHTNHMYTCQLIGFVICLPLCGNWNETFDVENLRHAGTYDPPP